MSPEELYESWVKLGKEKIELFKLTVQLEEKIEVLENQVKKEFEKNNDQDLKILKREQASNSNLEFLNARLTEALKDEQQKRADLEIELAETYKKIRMLNSGTTKLDDILNSGRTSKVHYGIGYNGLKNTAKTVFVAGSTSHANELKPVTSQKIEGSGSMFGKQNTIQESYKQRSGQGYSRKVCYHCGKNGHIRRKCKVFKQWVQTLIQQGHGYQNKGRKNQVWISKVKLYKKTESNRTKSSMLGAADQTKTIQGECVAFMAGKKLSRRRWYFDSGASRHMTGNQSLLDDYAEIEESKVTFGGGASGMIKGKGRLADPDLKNVLYVQGLKVNLISVSQLSDEGYTISFNGKNCAVRDNSNKIVMTGIRADKNCYIWEPMDVCFKAEKNEMIFDCICSSKQKEI